MSGKVNCLYLFAVAELFIFSCLSERRSCNLLQILQLQKRHKIHAFDFSFIWHSALFLCSWNIVVSNGDSNKEKENNTVKGRKEDKPEMGGRRERERIERLSTCVFVVQCVVKSSLCFQLQMHVHVSYPASLQRVCVSLAPVSSLEQSSTGRPAGWLAAQERKQSLSNSRWRTACAYTAETHM